MKENYKLRYDLLYRLNHLIEYKIKNIEKRYKIKIPK